VPITEKAEKTKAYVFFVNALAPCWGMPLWRMPRFDKLRGKPVVLPTNQPGTDAGRKLEWLESAG
jgi:hypothetical protein